MSIENKLKSRLLELDPSITGTIAVAEVNNIITVKSSLVSNLGAELEKAIKAVVSEEYPARMVSYDLKVNNGLTVMTNEGSVTTRESTSVLDEVDILFYGEMEVKDITPRENFKFTNETHMPVIKNAINVLKFIAPIVLDSNLKVIDGDLRLRLAKELGIRKVLVVVVNDSDIRSEYLALTLNRSSEFQRWNYREVDHYVDSVPQAQPILEPLGFFGNNVLPESFFADSILEYEIDPFNTQQHEYRQEHGLAEWAKIRKAEIKAAHEAKQAPKKAKAAGVSLFNLAPKKDDFLETYNTEEEIETFINEMKDVAGTVTDNYDAIKKAELEAKGKAWQNSRRTSKQVAKDNRQAFYDHIEELELEGEIKDRVLMKLDELRTPEEIDELVRKLTYNE